MTAEMVLVVALAMVLAFAVGFTVSVMAALLMSGGRR